MSTNSAKKIHQTIIAITPGLVVEKAAISQKLQSNPSFHSDFLLSISHELKTPLNAIIGCAEILKSEIKNPHSLAECLDFLNDITSVAEDMNELIHDLLDVGSID